LPQKKEGDETLAWFIPFLYYFLGDYKQ